MSQCIYTGAYVHFQDYNAYAVADIFQCGNQVLIQWQPDSWEHASEINPIPPPTHVVKIGHGYHHAKRGITVVNGDNVQGERR